MGLKPRLASLLPLALLLAIPSFAISQSAAASSTGSTSIAIVCDSIDPLSPAGCDPDEVAPEPTPTATADPEPEPTADPVEVPAPAPVEEPEATVPAPAEQDYYYEADVVVPSAPQIPIPTTTPAPVALWDVPTYAEGPERPADRTALYALVASLALLVILGVAFLGRGIIGRVRGMRKPISQKYGLSEDEANNALTPGEASDFTAFDHMVLSYDRNSDQPPADPPAPPAPRP